MRREVVVQKLEVVRGWGAGTQGVRECTRVTVRCEKNEG